MSTLSNLIFNGKSHYISSSYGKRTPIKTSSGYTSSFHKGTDYATNGKTIGQYAVADGTVRKAGTDGLGGKFVDVEYPSLGVWMRHYHLSKIGTKKGAKVSKGTYIGNTGKSGKATGVHLHLEVHNLKTDATYNPETWSKNNSDKLKKSSTKTETKKKTESKTETKTEKKKPDAKIADAEVKTEAFNSTASKDFVIYVKKGDKTYDISELVSSAEWSGSVEQASRQLGFSYIRDASFEKFTVEIGDIIAFYFLKKLQFVGIVDSVNLGAGTSEVSVQSSDFMSLLLKDTISMSFKKMNATEICKKVCKQVGIGYKSLPSCKKKIDKIIVDGETAYNVIISAFYKEFKATKVKYIPRMEQTKLTIVQKGESSGGELRLGENLISTQLTSDLDAVVDRVIYFDSNGRRLGVVEDKASQKLYGVRQAVYKQEGSTNAKDGAKAMLHGVEQSIDVEAMGIITAIAGRSIKLYDSESGLEGTFWIESDRHSISSGSYTMSLSLTFQNLMEGQESKTALPDATKSKVCYYSSTGKCYHSKKTCGGNNFQIKTTVAEAEKNRSKCSKCWSKI